MNHARVFLCTSRQEGFGLTGLESIFCGCVLVTTDCRGIREYASQRMHICVEWIMSRNYLRAFAVLSITKKKVIQREKIVLKREHSLMRIIQKKILRGNNQQP